MGVGNRADYWDLRSGLSYEYKGELFYTVTPIPLYYRRRKLLLELMHPYIGDEKAEKICDFGCGDGWYLRYFSDKLPGKQWYGVDLSQAMIDRAKVVCPNAQLEVSGDGIQYDELFDVIYSVAVFAHVTDDEMVKSLFSNIRQRLQPNGSFIVFEQTGKDKRAGDTWCRRHTSEYLDFARHCGLETEKRSLIAFPLHRKFEKKVYPLLARLYRGRSSAQRSISLNKSPFFRFLSSAILALSGPPIWPDDGVIDGNSLYIFRKSTGQKCDCP